MIENLKGNFARFNKNSIKAVQCLWDSDFNYLGLSIELIHEDSNGFQRIKVAELNYFDFEIKIDLRLVDFFLLVCQKR